MKRKIKQIVLTLLTALLFSSCEVDIIDKVGIEVGIALSVVAVMVIPMGVITLHELYLYFNRKKRSTKKVSKPKKNLGKFSHNLYSWIFK